MPTGASGNAVSTYAYDPWGNVVSQTGGLANPLEYTGTIATSGFYDPRARFYDSSFYGAHSFLSADPLGGGYLYAGDGPVNARDPSGVRPILGGVVHYVTGDYDLDTEWYSWELWMAGGRFGREPPGAAEAVALPPLLRRARGLAALQVFTRTAASVPMCLSLAMHTCGCFMWVTDVGACACTASTSP